MASRSKKKVVAPMCRLLEKKFAVRGLIVISVDDKDESFEIEMETKGLSDPGIRYILKRVCEDFHNRNVDEV